MAKGDILKARAKRYDLAVRAVLDGKLTQTKARQVYKVHSLYLLNKLKAHGYVAKRSLKNSRSMLNAVKATVTGQLNRHQAAKKFGVNYDVLEGKILDYRNGVLKMDAESPKKSARGLDLSRACKRRRLTKTAEVVTSTVEDDHPSTSHTSPAKRASMPSAHPAALVPSNQLPNRPQKLIDRILEIRTVRQYLVKWKNVAESGNTWELADSVKAHVKNNSVVIPAEADDISPGVRVFGAGGPHLDFASLAMKATEEREGSPEILPPPQRTSVSKSKSAGDSPTPSTPLVPNASPGTLVPESEANIPVAPEEPLSPPLIFTVKPLQARLDQIFVQQKGKRQSKKGRPAKAKKTVENTNQDEAPVADEKPSIAHIPLPEEDKRDTVEERVALGSPMSEDATLFGEPEEVGTESKPEIKVAAPVSSVEISDDDGSLEAFISECDNEDAISVDRLETAILSDEDLSWTGAISDSLSPKKRMVDVRAKEMPRTSLVQPSFDDNFSPQKVDDLKVQKSSGKQKFPFKTDMEAAREAEVGNLADSENVGQLKQDVLRWSTSEIVGIIGASLESDEIFRLKVKWIEKGSEEAQTGWVPEDIYQDWNSDLQKMIKNFFLKYGMPSVNKPEITV